MIYAFKFCNKSIAYRASRLHRQLNYKGRVHDVTYRVQVHPQVRQLFATSNGKTIPSYLEDIPFVPPNEQDSQEEYETINFQSTNLSKAKITKHYSNGP
jgi:hypothetical protein